MRNFVTLLITLILFCGFAEQSHASSTFPWPNLVVNPVAAPELAPDVASAMAYWNRRGIPSIPCTVQAWWVDTINMYNKIGLGGGCDLALRRNSMLGIPHTPLEQWNLIVHETGHTLGLQHDDPRFPIMAASPSLDTVPLSEKVPVSQTVKKAKKTVKRCNRKHQRHRKRQCKRRSTNRSKH